MRVLGDFRAVRSSRGHYNVYVWVPGEWFLRFWRAYGAGRSSRGHYNVYVWVPGEWFCGFWGAFGVTWSSWGKGGWRTWGPSPTPRVRSLGLAGRSWSVWVWVGSHTNWTGVVGCASHIYANAMTPHPHNHAEPYLTIFAFGSDHFGSTSGAFGQVWEIRIEPSTRFWRVWLLGARSVVSTGRSGRFV